MTGTNHALTGALIATAVGNPIAAVPLAFASHFVLDAVPHYGEELAKRSTLMRKVWLVDGTFLLVGLVILIFTQNWLAMLGAYAAISPDFVWIYRYIFEEKWGTLPPTKKRGLNKFHSWIQKYETRKGLVFEIIWFVGVAYLCAKFVL